jgi:hypothetical protein|tara:strand:- start:306 stop:494 length:189 start_codon:yes stop_codon:yes gene_type:complete
MSQFKKDMTLTSVKIEKELFQKFKIECVRNKFSFQKLAERCIHSYLNDEEFRRSVTNMKIEF